MKEEVESRKKKKSTEEIKTSTKRTPIHSLSWERSSYVSIQYFGFSFEQDVLIRFHQTRSLEK